MLFWTFYNSLQDDWLIDPKIHQPYQSLSHLYESSDAFSLSNSSHHLNFIGWNFVGLDFVGLQNRKSNHRLIFQFTFWWETHSSFENITDAPLSIHIYIMMKTFNYILYDRKHSIIFYKHLKTFEYICIHMHIIFGNIWWYLQFLFTFSLWRETFNHIL